MTMLYETYRPRVWSDVVGHNRTTKSIQRLSANGTLGGRSFWISGPSGIGKTSIAYLIAGDVCDADNFVEIDAGSITPKDLDDLERLLRCRAIGEKSGRAVLINESHGLRQDAIRKLLVALERIPQHVTWIFTTTDAGQGKLFKDIDAHPLLSRCLTYELTIDDYAHPMISRVMQIADAEGLGGAKRELYVQCGTACKFNMRAMLNEVEKGTMLRYAEAVAG